MRVALYIAAVLVLLAPLARAADAPAGDPPRRPNVLVIITDDQGYGDLACNGNPIVRTPNLDALAKESVRLTQFYVSPVCSPTRASLLTGRYSYRTGVVDTYLGRSMMHADEVTLAEMLRWAGYRTGLFGKWHLGDNYPMRAMDQGFGETLVLKGGGLGQPSDIPGGGSYFSPVLLRNGKPQKTEGYVSDVLAEATMDFIDANRGRPFFACLAFNAPHEPLKDVPKDLYAKYKEMDLSASRFVAPGWPLPERIDADKVARVYAMVTNIDANVGRVLAKLKALNLDRDTIVVFLTDNGPQQARFNAGMRGLKGSPYDGGVRVPCFVRWPAGLGPASGTYVDRVAAHIDMAPTLLEACGVPHPPGVAFDGVSLLPLLRGDVANDAWPDRTLFFQWHRGDAPEVERSFGARNQRWKLVQPAGANGNDFQPRYELYDLAAEPFEARNVAERHADVVEELHTAYQHWFESVTTARPAGAPRIVVGSPHENPVVLTRQDWRGPRAGWGPKNLGYWDVRVAAAGPYELTLSFPATDGAKSAHLRIGAFEAERPLEPGQTTVKFTNVTPPAGDAKLEAWLAAGDDMVGVHHVDVLNPHEVIP
jgi:arylsulfatase A-like enzyme